MGERISNCIPLIAAGFLLASGCRSISPGSGDSRGRVDNGFSESDIPVEAIAHFATALSYDMDGRSDEASEEYARAALKDPSYEPVVIESARRSIRAGEPDKAISVLEQSATRKEASGTIYSWLGLAYGQSGKVEKSIQANKKAIQKLPRSLAAYQNLSQIYLQNGRTNDVLAVLDQAAKQTLVSPDFLIDLADLNDRFGQTRSLGPELVKRRVIELLDRSSALNSENPIILQRLGDGYANAGEIEKSERAYLGLLERYPGSPIVRSKLADLYLRSANREKAVYQLKELAKANPTNGRTYAILGMLELDGNDITNAVSNLERALVLSPEFENVYYDLARANLGLRKSEEALKVLEKARSRFKDNFVLEFYTGMAYASMEKYADAVRHFLSAEILSKNQEQGSLHLNRQFYFQIGSAYERNGDPEQAAQYFEKCLELSPDFAPALNYLGYMWADLGIQLERARELIEKAVQFEPENPAYLDSLAWVFFKLKQPKEALPHMVKAIEKLEEPEPEFYDHLGDIYDSLGDRKSAIEAWQKSLVISDDPKVRQKLESGRVDSPASR
ncbi:MAG: tetratricopeptide repeat protein [Verrucomicrobia bacterium]|nr:tetratricopeptide repeat protein [Verrucomicrobiota bacterium]